MTEEDSTFERETGGRTLRIQSEKGTATTMSFGANPDKWVMRIIIEDEGKDARIVFNREAYPDCLADEFAREVGEILCRCGFLREIKGRQEKESEMDSS